MARTPLMTVMVRAVMAAAKGLRRDFNEVEQLQVSIKGPGDFVSAADRRAEDTLKRELEKARPGYGFVLEEGGLIEGTDPDHLWHIDPLDGTTNFLHAVPHFAISVGLERAGQIVAGVIYNPITDELFTAERGQGAFLNDRRIRVAAPRSLDLAMIACGLPHPRRGDRALFLRELHAVQSKFAAVRRFGSAALDLAWTAAGRYDGYWERDLATWDIAAGILLVREAGGFVTDFSGGGDMMKHGALVAGSERTQAELLAILKSV